MLTSAKAPSAAPWWASHPPRIALRWTEKVWLLCAQIESGRMRCLKPKAEFDFLCGWRERERAKKIGACSVYLVSWRASGLSKLCSLSHTFTCFPRCTEEEWSLSSSSSWSLNKMPFQPWVWQDSDTLAETQGAVMKKTDPLTQLSGTGM